MAIELWSDKSWVERLWWHTGVTALVGMLMIPLVLLTADRWAPFDYVESASAVVEEDKFKATLNMTVYNRYKVLFTRRLVHMESGMNTIPSVHQPATARIGQFPLRIVEPMPAEYEPGTWCLFIEAVVHYNALLNARVRSYEPICAVVQ